MEQSLALLTTSLAREELGSKKRSLREAGIVSPLKGQKKLKLEALSAIKEEATVENDLNEKIMVHNGHDGMTGGAVQYRNFSG